MNTTLRASRSAWLEIRLRHLVFLDPRHEGEDDVRDEVGSRLIQAFA
jgi:hypothetical protein